MSDNRPRALKGETRGDHRPELGPGPKPKASFWETVRIRARQAKYVVFALAQLVGIALLIAIPVVPVVALAVALVDEDLKQTVFLGGAIAYLWLVTKAIERYTQRLDAQNEQMMEDFRRAQEEEARKRTAQERIRLEENNRQGPRVSSGESRSRSAGASNSSVSFIVKSTYRKVAIRIHPDHAVDEKDRARREELMKEANVAYSAGDIQTLQRLLGMEL